MNYVFTEGRANLSHAGPTEPHFQFCYLVRDADGHVIPFCTQADTVDGLVFQYRTLVVGEEVAVDLNLAGHPSISSSHYAAPLTVEEFPRMEPIPQDELAPGHRSGARLSKAWWAAYAAQVEAVRNPPPYRRPEKR